MFVLEYQDREESQTALTVFVSDYDIKIPYAAKKSVSPAKIADELDQIIGFECTGYQRAELSTEKNAYLTRGYMFTCHNQKNYRHSASEIRSAVRSIIETLKEERV